MLTVPALHFLTCHVCYPFRVAEDPARSYLLRRTVYRLTARVFELARSNDFALRSDLMALMREAISAGRWYEQASQAEAERTPDAKGPMPKIIVAPELWDDDDADTLPNRPR